MQRANLPAGPSYRHWLTAIAMVALAACSPAGSESQYFVAGDGGGVGGDGSRYGISKASPGVGYSTRFMMPELTPAGARELTVLGAEFERVDQGASVRVAGFMTPGIGTVYSVTGPLTVVPPGLLFPAPDLLMESGVVAGVLMTMTAPGQGRFTASRLRLSYRTQDGRRLERVREIEYVLDVTETGPDPRADLPLTLTRPGQPNPP